MEAHDQVPMKTHDEMPLGGQGLIVDTSDGLEEINTPTLPGE